MVKNNVKINKLGYVDFKSVLEYAKTNGLKIQNAVFIDSVKYANKHSDYKYQNGASFEVEGLDNFKFVVSYDSVIYAINTKTNELFSNRVKTGYHSSILIYDYLQTSFNVEEAQDVVKPVILSRLVNLGAINSVEDIFNASKKDLNKLHGVKLEDLNNVKNPYSRYLKTFLIELGLNIDEEDFLTIEGVKSSKPLNYSSLYKAMNKEKAFIKKYYQFDKTTKYLNYVHNGSTIEVFCFEKYFKTSKNGVNRSNVTIEDLFSLE